MQKLFIQKKVRDELVKMYDNKNQIFLVNLLPTVKKEKILGIKTPLLRAYAKKFAQNEEMRNTYLGLDDHYYFEEWMIHAFLIEIIKEYSDAIALTEQFLPHIDNRALCDSFLPPVFKKNTNLVYQKIKIWLKSKHEYTVRYGIKLLLSCYLDEKLFKDEMFEQVTQIAHAGYYVQMMQAWYFATALVKQEDKMLSLLKSKTLVPFVQNKTIQKARESKRISESLKRELINYKM